MSRWFLSILLLLFAATFASAQSDEEAKFNAKQAKALNDYAELAMKEGFPKVAKRIWLMVLSEYDADHEGAREGLGYENIDGSWAKKPGFVFPKDDNPDSKAANKVKKRWEKVSADVAKAHKQLAEKYDSAGRADMAARHYKKVLFYAPDDEDAQGAVAGHAPGALAGSRAPRRGDEELVGEVHPGILGTAEPGLDKLGDTIADAALMTEMIEREREGLAR